MCSWIMESMLAHQEVAVFELEEYPGKCQYERVAEGLFACQDKRGCPFAINYAGRQLCMDPFLRQQDGLASVGMGANFEHSAIE